MVQGEGRADPVTTALQWLGIRLGELKALMQVAGGAAGLSPLGFRHWCAILEKLHSPSWQLAALLRSPEGQCWQHRASLLVKGGAGSLLNLHIVELLN